MNNLLFTGIVLVVLGTILFLGFKILPKERWQILGAIPKSKGIEDTWTGRNFTYYGILNANACSFAVAILILLLGAVNIPFLLIVSITVAILGICIPSSKIIAKIVEKKPCTISIGGAFFIGILLMPWIVLMTATLFEKKGAASISAIHVLASILIAYAFGEGLGRLACISFGCCYGKPLKSLSPFLQRIFNKYSFIYTGKTKKIAYASGLEGEKIIPVQAMTCIIYCLAGVAGIYLYLEGYPRAAFIETLVITQLWRFLSEFLRADHRGSNSISAYQIMAVFAAAYGTLLGIFMPANSASHPHIMTGLARIWTPSIILFLQGIWWMTFLHSGQSQVTGSILTFHILKDKI